MGKKGASCMPTLSKENCFFKLCQVLFLWHNALGKMQSLPQSYKTSERTCSFCFVLLSWSFCGYNIVLFLCLLCWGPSRKSYFVFDSLWGDTLCGSLSFSLQIHPFYTSLSITWESSFSSMQREPSRTVGWAPFGIEKMWTNHTKDFQNQTK